MLAWVIIMIYNSPHRIMQIQNLVRNFDLGTAVWNCPIWNGKSQNKDFSLHRQNCTQNFHFPVQNFRFLRAEFLFAERGILGV